MKITTEKGPTAMSISNCGPSPLHTITITASPCISNTCLSYLPQTRYHLSLLFLILLNELFIRI